MNKAQVFKPNFEYFQNLANSIARRSGYPQTEISRIDINCGNGSPTGWVILKNGEKVAV